MKTMFKKSVVLLTALAMLLMCTPLQGVAADGMTTFPGTVSTSYASRPSASQATTVLGISEYEVEQLKNAIFSTAYNFGEMCDVTRFKIPYSEEVAECISGLISDTMPELFNINNWMFYKDDVTGFLAGIEFTNYQYSSSDYADMLQRCREVTEYLTHDLVDSDLTPAKKALVLHDRLAVWVDYDQAAIKADNVPYIDHTMYGALWNRLAVCDGYAEAYMYLLRAVGIDSYVCRSETLYHAWNIVFVEGEYYHVDVTKDDPVWDVTGRVNHNFFLRSSAGNYAAGNKATDYDTTPTDTKFDEGWSWFSSTTAHHVFGDRIYYIDNEREKLCYWEGNTLYDVLSVEDTWWLSGDEYYNDNFSRLSADEHYLYYSLAQSVHRYDPKTGKSDPLHYPDFSGRKYHNIYGMKVQFNTLICDITDNPAFSADTKKYRQELATYRKNEVEYILIEELPIKKEYRTGESLDTSGLMIKVRDSNGDCYYITDGFTVDGFAPDKSGEQVLTVSYGGHTTTFTVKVVSAERVTMGDVNGNGRIDSTDARLVLQYAVGKIEQNAIIFAAADVSGNNKIDSTDARLVLQYAVGKIQSFPVAK